MVSIHGIQGEEVGMAGWRIEGEYMESCNCSFLCPCIVSNLAEAPTEGDCKAAVAMKIAKGEKDGVSLDGLAFIVLMHAPGPMGAGGIKVGLIVDAAADDAQAQAIGDIASGAAGGPMAGLAPLVAGMLGVEKRPISFDVNGLERTVRAGDLIDQSISGVPSVPDPTEPVCIDNTLHPANARLALAKATRSHFHAFGVDWDDASGTRNGHFAPFSWAA
jgi:hypothetical protein